MALTHGVNDPARKGGKKTENNKSDDKGKGVPDELKEKTYKELLDMANEGQPKHEKYAGNTSKAKLIEAIMAKLKTD